MRRRGFALPTLALCGALLSGPLLPVSALAQPPAQDSAGVSGVVVDIADGPDAIRAVDVNGTLVSVDPAAVAGLAAGTKVRIDADGGVLVVESLARSARAPLSNWRGNVRLTVLPVYTGTQPAAFTVPLITATADSAASYWATMTNGALRLAPNVLSPREVVGSASCNPAEIYNQAASAFGSSIVPTVRERVLILFSRSDACQWEGLAETPGGRSWVNGTLTPLVWQHELGHNLGLSHSALSGCPGALLEIATVRCAPKEYDDTADVMGADESKEAGSLSAPQLDRLGLLAATTIPASRTVNFALAPISSRGGNRAAKLRLPRSTLYFEFRPALGRDALESGLFGQVTPGVQVRQRVDGDARPRLVSPRPTEPSADDFSIDTRLLPYTPWNPPGSQTALTLMGIGTAAVLRAAPLSSAPRAPQRTVLTSPAGSAVPRRVTLRWRASADRAVLVAYRVIVDGGLRAVVGVPATSFTVSLSDGSHRVRIDAINQTGKVSRGIERSLAVLNRTPAVPSLSIPKPWVINGVLPLRIAGAVRAGDLYELLVDGRLAATRRAGDWGTVTSARVWRVSTAKWAEGRRSISVRIRTAAGVSALSPPITVGVDRVAPSVPSGVVAVPRGVGAWTIGWNASTDRGGAIRYEIRRGKAVVARSSLPVTRASVVGGLVDLRVVAIDPAGRESVSAAPVQQADVWSGTPAAIVKPAVVPWSKDSAVVTWRKATAKTVVGYCLTFDQVVCAASVSGATTSARLTRPVNKSTRLTVRALTAGDAFQDSPSVAIVRWDVTAPLPVRLLAPRPGSTSSTTSMTWRAPATTGAPVAGYEVYVDGKIRLRTKAWSARVTLIPGQHLLWVNVVDAAGNRSTGVLTTVTVAGTSASSVKISVAPGTRARGTLVPVNVVVRSLRDRRAAALAVIVGVEPDSSLVAKTRGLVTLRPTGRTGEFSGIAYVVVHGRSTLRLDYGSASMTLTVPA